ncbi:MAG: hypothetical protein IH946_04830, partial [Bacteroidetes bacterium]|nr:hypothetical protein [Bacteroidota bacterium]
MTKNNYIKVIDTVSEACYVQTSNLSNSFNMGIARVKFNLIDNSTGDAVTDGGYLDFSCTIIDTVIAGNYYSMTIVVGPLNAEDGRVWIDYDNSGTFESTEMIWSHNNDTLTWTVDSIQ